MFFVICVLPFVFMILFTTMESKLEPIRHNMPYRKNSVKTRFTDYNNSNILDFDWVWLYWELLKGQVINGVYY